MCEVMELHEVSAYSALDYMLIQVASAYSSLALYRVAVLVVEKVDPVVLGCVKLTQVVA
jgi:hypothetical protein